MFVYLTHLNKFVKIFLIIVGFLILLIVVKNVIVNYFQNNYLSNPDNCEKMGSNRNACFNSAAQIKKDPRLCERISTQSGDPQSDSKDSCFSNVAEIVLNSKLCANIQKISGDGSRDTCYNNIAAKTKNMKLCNKMVGQSTTIINGGQVYVDKDFCIQAVAMEKLDASICNNMLQKIHKQSSPLQVSVQSCYAFIGQNSKNALLCDKAGELKASCLEGAKQK